jgi:beta-galactosidase
MRKVLFSVLFFINAVAFAQSETGTPSRNDHTFPPAAAAKPFINYDNRGFMINGKRVFIVSAGMEYARVPRALWHDRLLRLKRAGFNAVEMYTFWNFHEPKEGEFDFSGDHDLDAFLQMIKQMGMYAIVRVGPYYCGEWNLGGYPIWLKLKPGVRVREDNPQFLNAVDHFFDKLIPIVAKNQVNHDGPVIMVQLENEHRAGWGTVTPNGYFRHLISKTVSLGLQVPYFFSGLHSGNDPAGDVASLDDPARPNPWFSTEYWGVWFLNYGPQELDSTLYDRRTWKIIAHGGKGYNVYMAHGGTNFDYNNDRDNAASYDYGASVGQAGDLRPIYYSFKRAAWFARSFQDILENSLDEPADKPAVTDTNINVTVRKSPAGNIAFLDNRDSVAVEFTVKNSLDNNIPPSPKIKLAPGEIMPVVQDFALTKTIKIAWAPARIYAVIPQGNTTTLLIYGDAGSAAQLYFNAPPNTTLIKGQQNFKMLSENLLRFEGVINAASPTEYIFSSGNSRIRIIVVNQLLATHSWIADEGGKARIIIGPSYVADAVNKNGHQILTTEQPWTQSNNSPVWVFNAVEDVVKIDPSRQPVNHPTKLLLRTWQTKDASAAALPGYDDTLWKQSKEPLQMGNDGDITADAWYRTQIKVTETGDYTLQFKTIHDRAGLFLNGSRIDTGEIFNKTQNLHLRANTRYTLALFTAHDGRNKLIFRTGEIDTLDAKGLSGPVTLQKKGGSLTEIINWRMKGGPGDPFAEKGWKALEQSDSPLRRSAGVCHSCKLNTPPCPRFYRTTFYLPNLKNAHPIWRVNTTSMDHGSVWVNGHNLGRYPEKIKINGLYIPECWLKTGVNKLVIYEENGASPRKVAIEAEAAASRDIQHLKF